MSVNNVLYTADTQPIVKYAKAIPSKLIGRRLDPMTGGEIDFILETKDPDNFVYEDEVLEIYNERELRFFKQVNRPFITQGYLKVYNGEAGGVPMENILSDEQVEDIASIRTPNELKKKINVLTSRVALNRVLTAAKEIGRPKSIILVIEKRISEV